MYHPDQPAKPSAPLRRVPHGRAVCGLFTSEQAYRFRTHWHEGRSLPCVVHRCPLCQLHAPARVYGYVAALMAHDKAHVVLELPWGALTALESTHEMRGTLRGLAFRAFRTDERRTAPVQICTHEHEGKPPKIDALDVVGVLCTLWEVPYPEQGEGEHEHAQRVRDALWSRFRVYPRSKLHDPQSPANPAPESRNGSSRLSPLG